MTQINSKCEYLNKMRRNALCSHLLLMQAIATNALINKITTTTKNNHLGRNNSQPRFKKKYEQKPNRITGQWPRNNLIFLFVSWVLLRLKALAKQLQFLVWIIANLSIVTMKSIGPKFRHFKWAFYGLAIFRVAAAFLRILSSFPSPLILWQPIATNDFQRFEWYSFLWLFSEVADSRLHSPLTSFLLFFSRCDVMWCDDCFWSVHFHLFVFFNFCCCFSIWVVMIYLFSDYAVACCYCCCCWCCRSLLIGSEIINKMQNELKCHIRNGKKRNQIEKGIENTKTTKRTTSFGARWMPMRSEWKRQQFVFFHIPKVFQLREK